MIRNEPDEILLQKRIMEVHKAHWIWQEGLYLENSGGVWYYKKGECLMMNNYTSVLVLCWMSLLILSILIYENDRLPLADKGMFYMTFVLIGAAALAEWCGVLLDGKPEYPDWLLLTAKCGDYTLTPLAVVALVRMRAASPWKKKVILVLIVNAVFEILGAIFGWTVVVDAQNHYSHGPLFPVYIGLCLLLVALLTVQFVRFGRQFRRQNRISMYAIMLMVVLAIVIQENYDGCRTVYLGLTLGAALFFIHYTEFSQLAADDAMTEQRIQLMLSQIKPHFLYNTLGSIEALCELDPHAAKLSTRKFSKYLRGNMDAISGANMIPFERELQHTELFLDLERTRFGDALQVQQKIGAKEFFLPPLTLEPIVENAVKHGIRMNPDGRGLILIETEKREDCYEIRVTDDGPGFDPKAIPDDGTHVGIHNVAERLERICGGTLQIDSVPGRGTTVTIRLPKKRSDE